MQVEQNNSKENQENKTISLVKKLSFLWVILGAALIHFLIKKVGFVETKEGIYIFLLWFGATVIIVRFIAYNFTSSYRGRWNDYNNSELDISENDKKVIQKRLDVEKNGIVGVAEVIRVSSVGFGGCPTVVFYIIEYSFTDKSGKKFIILKKYCESLVQNCLKVGDKLEIMYKEFNPSDSIMVYESADKVSWYKLQKKYKIKIITNNANN